ncbi:ABC transporter ATP-binding protein [Oscillatoria amoena NRMC-F 0135]|nr:ABC transporter ATP-binding protein [Oscillatoria amoena NRMC-F 0135]
MLEIKDLTVAYGPVEALHGVSLHVAAGEIVTLIGSNGAGKSTLLRTISGLIRPRTGTILFRGSHQLEKTKPHLIVREGLTQVPEGRGIFAQLTVWENLQMGSYLRCDNQELGEDYEYVFKLFPVLKERRDQKAGTLSGGEQQMLAIGRALMGKPRLLLLDEPSLGLAPLVTQTIFATLREINDSGTTILLVEQNARQALKLAHRGYVIETGRIVLEDRAQNLLNSEEVKKAYLGEI